MNDWDDRALDAALQELHGSRPPDLSARVLLALRDAAPGPLPRLLPPPAPRRALAWGWRAAALLVGALTTWCVLAWPARPQPTRQVLALVEVDVALGEVACVPADAAGELGRTAAPGAGPIVVLPGASASVPLAADTRLRCAPASAFTLGAFGDLSTRPFTELEVETMEFRKDHGVVAATFLTLGVVTGGVAWQAFGRTETAVAGEVVRLEAKSDVSGPVAVENAALKARLQELEAQLADLRSQQERMAVVPTKVEPEVAKPTEAKPPAAFAMLFSDPKFAEALAKIDWAQMGTVTNEMAPMLAELVAAMAKEGAEVPMELALKIQKLNGALVDAVPAMLKAGLPGFGPNGSYTHPLVAANTLASTLAAAGKSLSPAQQQAMEGLVRMFSAEAQSVADGQHDFKLQQLLAETEMKDRFYRELGGQLSPEQAAVMNPNGAGKYDGSSLFSSGLMTRSYAQPIAARDAGEFARTASSRLADQLGLDEATANQVRDVVARAAAASELWQDRGDPTETSLRMMRAGRTQAALRNQLVWMQQIQQQVNLTPEQRQKLASMQQVLVPLPR